MRADKENKVWTTIYGLFAALGLVVCLMGFVLAVAGLLDVSDFTQIDADSFLHEPTIYFSQLRDIVGKAVNEIVIGMCIVILGAVVLTVALVRYAATKNEKRRIIELEARIEKLEQAKNQRKKA